jgi:uncharacterized protein YecE (DUF72 family)
MMEAGRLDAVLFQFPYSFKYDDDNRRYLGKLLKAFENVPSAVEFRKSDWYTAKVIDCDRLLKLSVIESTIPSGKVS